MFIKRQGDIATCGAECDDWPTLQSPKASNLPLVTSTLPRYRLTLALQLSGSSTIVASATLVDKQTGLTIGSINNWATTRPTSWYNNTARRFGMGGIKASPFVIPFDNFVGTF